MTVTARWVTYLYNCQSCMMSFVLTQWSLLYDSTPFPLSIENLCDGLPYDLLGTRLHTAIIDQRENPIKDVCMCAWQELSI